MMPRPLPRAKRRSSLRPSGVGEGCAVDVPARCTWAVSVCFASWGVLAPPANLAALVCAGLSPARASTSGFNAAGPFARFRLSTGVASVPDGGTATGAGPVGVRVLGTSPLRKSGENERSVMSTEWPLQGNNVHVEVASGKLGGDVCTPFHFCFTSTFFSDNSIFFSLTLNALFST